MRINKAIIDQHNEVNHKVHRQKFDFIKTYDFENNYVEFEINNELEV